jgi:hypothetical protein
VAQHSLGGPQQLTLRVACIASLGVIDCSHDFHPLHFAINSLPFIFSDKSMVCGDLSYGEDLDGGVPEGLLLAARG